MDGIDEFKTRLEYFSTLDKFIEEENAKGHNYTLGHNQFSDWSRDEYTAMLGYKPSEPKMDRTFKNFDESKNGD